LVPLIPYILTRGAGALMGTIAATAVSLLAIGAAMSLFTAKKSGGGEPCGRP